VQGAGCREQGAGCREQGAGSRVQGARRRPECSGFGGQSRELFHKFSLIGEIIT